MDEQLATRAVTYPVDVASQDTGIHKEIAEERKAALPAAEDVRKFRAYTRGRQRSTLEYGQTKILQGVLGNLYCDNICKRIVVETRNRLELVRYSVTNDPVLLFLHDLWIKNKMAALQASVHFAMLRDGNSAVTLGWAEDRVSILRELWWNGSTGIFVAYDDDDRVKYAVKDWYVRVDGQRRLRRIIWLPHQIQRYIQDANGWRPHRLPGDEEWPVPWMHIDGTPLGVPVVHFANIQIANDGEGIMDEIISSESDPDPRYGMSELDGGVLGLQDEINDFQRDTTAAGRYAGYQMVWGTGTTPRLDPDTHEEIPIEVEPGAVITDRNPDARFGTLTPGSLMELERGLKMKLEAVSRQTSLPIPVITGNWPSGDALLQFELPLTDKTRTIAGAAGPAWSTVGHKSTRIANTFGRAGLDEEALITAVFAPPERRDPITRAEYVAKIRQDISERERLIVLGYDPDEADRIMEERTEDAKRAAENAKMANEITGTGPLDNESNPNKQPAAAA